jgi:scyllo-inositol 2-dehydrogenase (NADP+)
VGWILRAGMLVPEETPRFVLRGTDGSYVKFGMDPQEDALKSGHHPKNTENWGTEPAQSWGTMYWFDGDSVQQEKIETNPGDYRGFYRMLADAVRGKGDVPVEPKHATEVIKIIECAFESSEKKKAIQLA